MELTALVRDEQAVSQVVGVILMVGITVLLAATAASFFLGLTNDKQTTSPRVAISADYDAATGSPPEATLKLTHESGDSVDATQVEIDIEGADTGSSTVDERFTWKELAESSPDDVSGGMSVVVDRDTLRDPSSAASYSELTLRGASVKVIWQDPGSSQSFVLGRWAGPAAQ